MFNYDSLFRDGNLLEPFISILNFIVCIWGTSVVFGKKYKYRIASISRSITFN